MTSLKTLRAWDGLEGRLPEDVFHFTITTVIVIDAKDRMATDLSILDSVELWDFISLWPSHLTAETGSVFCSCWKVICPPNIHLYANAMSHSFPWTNSFTTSYIICHCNNIIIFFLYKENKNSTLSLDTSMGADLRPSQLLLWKYDLSESPSFEHIQVELIFKPLYVSQNLSLVLFFEHMKKLRCQPVKTSSRTNLIIAVIFKEQRSSILEMSLVCIILGFIYNVQKFHVPENSFTSFFCSQILISKYVIKISSSKALKKNNKIVKQLKCIILYSK